MERWVPLFQIFLNSPSPVGEASLWLQQQQQQPPKPPHSLPHATSAFLSQLQTPTSVISHPTPTSPPTLQRCMWIQTLSPVVQSQILSFLAVESHRFCSRRLRALAVQILDSGGRREEDYFWVSRAARNLLDAVSTNHPNPIGDEEEEFDTLPQWLRSTAATANPLLPWLPVSRNQLYEMGGGGTTDVKAEYSVDVEEESEEDAGEEAQTNSELPHSDIQPLSPQIHDRASNLKAELLTADSASNTLRIANEIQELCFNSGGGGKTALRVLGLIEPWEADDEIASVLLSHLPGSGGLSYPDWPSHVLCSVVLPKLLTMHDPASRAILSATVDFCKLHQVAAVNALLLPAILCKEGIDTPLCDVLAKIIKECLHPAHVSAFCQKLLCGKGVDWGYICLPCHCSLISNELVWTESLFKLFQHILTRDVHLTPDTVDHLVSMLDNMAVKFAKSLKFGNFLLCLVTRCGHVLKLHKLSLMRVAERTDTFVTKSILSKLGNK